MSQCACPNGPPWSDDAIVKNWDALTSVFPQKWLPKKLGKRLITGKQIFEEYGCGNYGCVYPTEDPDIVFKITSDQTEADFVSTAASLQEPAGMVRYYAIYQINGERKRTRDSGVSHSNVYVMLRESAENIGTIRPEPEEIERIAKTERGREYLNGLDWFVRRLVFFKNLAGIVRRILAEDAQQGGTLIERAAAYRAEHGRVPSRLRRGVEMTYSPEYFHPEELVVPVFEQATPVQHFLQLHSALEDLSTLMTTDPVGQHVGGALRYYLDEGMLLADVHLKNVGVVAREADGKAIKIWAITDPGHFVRLRSDLPKVQIPDLEEA